MSYNKSYIAKAEALKPDLFKNKKTPVSQGKAVEDKNAAFGWKFQANNIAIPSEIEFKEQTGEVVLDFGDYCVGSLNFNIDAIGRVDCPLRLKILFGESLKEVAEGFADFTQSLGKGWLQDETLVIDDPFNKDISMPRRYAFRYVKIILEYNSHSYTSKISGISTTTVTSADSSAVLPLPDSVSKSFKDIDRISLNTLRHCMQTVFEDGPKRDRRLWLGDYRLQAIVNYCSFNNYDLCKRCLYLFAGLSDEKGRVPSCIYENPVPRSGEQYIYDYTALFPVALLEYVEASGDLDTARDLLPVALKQLDIVLEEIYEEGLFINNDTWWLFIDWNRELNKEACEQGVVIYSLKQTLKLLELVGDNTHTARLQKQIELMTEATIRELYDKEKGFFVSGPDKQVSWASHAWLALAEVIDKDTLKDMFIRLEQCDDVIQPAGPYLYHYIIEAMVAVGLEDRAFEIMENYWGGMVQHGCDTFWEVFDPEDLDLSPYNYVKMNSFCHAWSCTPSWFLRKK